jgi:hypothetical protein
MSSRSHFDLSYSSCIYNAYWFYKQLHSGMGQLRALRNQKPWSRGQEGGGMVQEGHLGARLGHSVACNYRSFINRNSSQNPAHTVTEISLPTIHSKQSPSTPFITQNWAAPGKGVSPASERVAG